MYDHEKSDPAIVAVKPTNKAGQPAAELVEPRAGAEGNVSQQSTGRAQYRGTVSQALARIRQASPLDTQGGSRMPELGPYGSVRGARGNSRPYRESHRGPVKATRMPSRPREFHPEPLTDPDLNLSIHPARAIDRRLPPSVELRAPPVASWPDSSSMTRPL